MAQNKNQLIVAELDLMASELESKGNLDLAGLIDEVSAELLTEEPVVVTKVEAKKAAPKPAKSNAKRRKKNKKKMSPPKVAVSRQDAKRVLKAAHAELLDIASELIKDGDIKEARKVIRYAEEVQKKQEEEAMETLPADEAELAPEEEGEDMEDGADGDDDAEEGDEEEPEEGDDDAEDSEEEEESTDEDDESDFEDEDDVVDEDVEAMLRKYDLMDDMPEAPAIPGSTSCTMTPAVNPEEEEAGDEEEEESESDDEASDDEDAEDGGDVAQADKLYSLAKKLAAAGETRAAFAIADLIDRTVSKPVVKKKASVYTIQLTPEEYASLSFFKNRGYDCGLLDALVVKDEAKGIYEIPEHEMWEINEACEEHGAWTNLKWDSSLGKKIRKLLDSVV